MTAVATACGFDKTQVHAMLPQRYVGTAMSNSSWFDGPRVNREWVGRTRVAACPRCLRANGGAWLVGWRLAWSVVCLEHRSYLARHCPNRACGRILRYPETWMECHPWLRSQYWPWRKNDEVNPDLPPVGSKLWCRPLPIGPPRTRDGQCLFPASMAVAQKVVDPWLLEFQRAVAVRADAVGERDREQAHRWFMDLKSKVRSVLIESMAESLDWVEATGSVSVADRPVAETWRRWIIDREAHAKYRPSGRQEWFDWRCAPGPPPLLMAAAVRVIAASDSEWREQVRSTARDAAEARG